MRIATALLVLAFCATWACAQAPGSFLTKWSDAKRAAAKAKKPIFIHFATTTCETCLKIQKEALLDDAVKKALGDYVCLTLDCTVIKGEAMSDEVKVNRSLAQRLGGSGCHFIAMVTADGVTLNSVEKFVAPKELLREFAAAKAVYREYQVYMAYANDPKTDKKSYDFAMASLLFYWKVREDEHAVAAAAQVLELDPENAKGDHVLAKLVQLEFSRDHPDKTAGLMEEVCKLDPQNEKTAFEKAMLMQVIREYQEYQLTKADPAEAKPHLETLLKLAQKARANEAKFKEPGKFYKMATQACIFLGEYDKAIEWTQLALSVSKNAKESKSLKELIDQIKAAKEKLASEPTSEPAK